MAVMVLYCYALELAALSAAGSGDAYSRAKAVEHSRYTTPVAAATRAP